jgi:plastocyanin domain-containing protein
MRHAVLALALLFAVPALATEPAKPVEKAPAAAKAGKKVAIKVTPEGFQPQQVKVKKGEPTTLEFTRVTDDTCMTEVDIPAENVKEFALPLNKTVSLTITPKKAGVEKFHCSAMGMGDGKIVVED